MIMNESNSSNYVLQTEINRLKQREAELLNKCHDLEDELSCHLAQFQQLAAIVEFSTEAIFVANLQGQILLCNPAAEKLFGYSSAEMVGETIARLVPEERKHEITVIDQWFQRGKAREQLETVRLHKAGTLIDISLTLSPIFDKDGQVLGKVMLAHNIGEQKLAEEKLRQSEQRYREMFENNHIIKLLIDLESLRIVDANQAACDFYGYCYSKIISLKITEITHDSEAENRAIIDRCRLNNDCHFIKTHYLASGESRVVMIYSGLIERTEPPLLFTIIRDITSRYAAEETLQKSHEQLENRVKERTAKLLRANAELERALSEKTASQLALEQVEKALQAERDFALQVMDHMGQGLVVFKPDFTIEYANPAFAKMSGYLVEELVGKASFDLVAACFFQKTGKIDWEQVPEQSTNFESELVRKDGSIFHAQISTQSLHRHGELTGIVVVISDLTDQKKSEQQLRRALEKEKELGEIKNRLISTISHEFRTPLSAIISSTELLEHYSQRWSEEKKGEILSRISHSASKLASLIEDILTYNRAEAGKIEFSRARIDLPNFCRDLVKSYQLNAGDSKTVRFVVLGSKSEAYLDIKLLGLILNNLLSNAVKYSYSGGTVELELTWQSENVIFKVKDQGIGIPASDQPNLFEPFQRASNVGTISGTGFGLAIVKRSVLAHKGLISVESSEGQGTTFTVSLPLIDPVAKDNTLDKNPLHSSTRPSIAANSGLESFWLLEQAIDASSSGVLITDANQVDNPIIYANKGFEKISGFLREEVIGKNCRFLQGDDRPQPDLEELRQAIKDERECLVTLRNYRKDGSLFWNELHISPLRNRPGKVEYFVGILNDVTDQVKARLALTQSKQKYKALVENSPDIVAKFDRNGRFLYVNPTLEKNTGGQLTAETVKGYTLSELGFSNELLDGFEGHLKKVIGTREPASFEIAPKILNQEKEFYQVQMIPEFSSDGKEVVSVLSIGRDITDLKRANKALEESQAHLSQILESIVDAFISFDDNWKFTYINTQAEKLLQHNREELLGKGIWEKFSEEAGSISSQMYQLARREGIAVNFEEYYAPLNSWFEVHAYPSVKGLSVFFKDITERKRVEEALERDQTKQWEAI